MKRFRITVDAGFAGATHEDEAEFEDEYWDSLSAQERDEVLESCVETTISNCIEGSWEEIE